MRVFIAWSGEPSRSVALALRGWLPKVIQSLKPWMSDEDIAKGERWSPAVTKALEESKFGVLCLTDNNLHADWLLFEAGAIAKSVSENAKVVPLLFDLEPKETPPGPLTLFQSTTADRDGVFGLLKSLNAALEKGFVEPSVLEETLDTWWSRFDEQLEEIRQKYKAQGATSLLRKPDELLSEILEVVRRLDRRANTQENYEALMAAFDPSRQRETMAISPFWNSLGLTYLAPKGLLARLAETWEQEQREKQRGEGGGPSDSSSEPQNF